MQHAHEILLRHLDHGRAGDAGDQRRSAEADGQHRQHQRVPAACARNRKPAEPHREHQDHQQRQPEARQRRAEQDAAHHGPVEQAVAEGGREHPGRDADDTSRRAAPGRRARRLCGRFSAISSRNGPAHHDGVAKVAGDELGEPDAVLHEQRLVEAVARDHLRPLLGRRADLDQMSSGSPGTRWMIMKITSETARNTGTSMSKRRISKRAWLFLPWCGRAYSFTSMSRIAP